MEVVENVYQNMLCLNLGRLINVLKLWTNHAAFGETSTNFKQNHLISPKKNGTIKRESMFYVKDDVDRFPTYKVT